MIYELTKGYISALKHLIQNIEYLESNFLQIAPIFDPDGATDGATEGATGGEEPFRRRIQRARELLLNINQELTLICFKLKPQLDAIENSEFPF